MEIRKAVADISALLTVNTLGSMVVEVFIAGMTFHQSLHARLTAIPIIIILARPYGLFRDWVFKTMRANEKGRVVKGLADILAFVAMMVPQYMLVLTLSGANLRQMVTACTVVTVLSTFAGRPVGLFLELFRKLFKV
jgi:hypothetical protein